jgi:hypothetical protein
MLRKTALKRLNLHNRTGELVAERVEAERCLRKMTFVSPCPQGQNRCECIGSALAGSWLLSVFFRKLRFACIRL